MNNLLSSNPTLLLRRSAEAQPGAILRTASNSSSTIVTSRCAPDTNIITNVCSRLYQGCARGYGRLISGAGQSQSFTAIHGPNLGELESNLFRG